MASPYHPKTIQCADLKEEVKDYHMVFNYHMIFNLSRNNKEHYNTVTTCKTFSEPGKNINLFSQYQYRYVFIVLNINIVPTGREDENFLYLF